MWTSLVFQVLICTRKERKKYQTNKRNNSNTDVHKHKQCKKNKNNTKKNKKSKKEKTSCSFMIVPLNLTLNNASASLINICCLGTLIYHMTLRTKCRFYEKTYLILNLKKKRNGFHDRFSFMQKLETGSHFDFHM